MIDNQKTVALKADGKVKNFTPEHAKNLLAYPGTVWSEVIAEQPKVKPAAEKPKRTPTKKK